MFTNINLLAIVVAAIVAQIIAMAWFMPPLFGLRWAVHIKRYTGLTDQVLGANLGRKVVLWFLGFLANACVLALLVRGTGAQSLADGMLLGAIVWFGFGAVFSSWPAIHANQPWGIWLINNGAYLTMQIAMAGILAVWR